MTLILVRHGQTAANAGARLQGRSDAPLTELGRRQASRIAGMIPAPSRVISSPLLRCTETAKELGLPVEVDERWIEIDYGGLDGLPLPQVPTSVWQRWRHDPQFVPAGGESVSDVSKRVRSACTELIGPASAADVVVVSHVTPIKAAVAWALGVGEAVSWRMFLDVAGVCRISFAQAGTLLLTFNETAHLAGLASSSMTTTTLSVPAIHCDHCKKSIEGALGDLTGVASAEVSIPDRTVTVAFDETAVDVERVREAIEAQGFDVER